MRFSARPFRRLQWQLSLSYTLVAAGSLLVVEIILLAGILYLIDSNSLSILLVRAFREQFSAQLRPFLDHPQPDLVGLNRYLSSYSTAATLQPGQETPLRTQIWTASDASQNLLVLDPSGSLLWAQLSAEELEVGRPLPPGLIPGLEKILPAALENAEDPNQLFTRLGNQMVMAVPVNSQDGQRVLGVVVFQLAMPSITNPAFMLQLLPSILISLLIFTGSAALVGSVFGYLTAHRLTSRLGGVSLAADAWSRGDFSTFIRDKTDDELGELARRLNSMAEHLRTLMATRQDLAALEERNRIARELHDSVKQQVFAASMQLGAARALMPEDNSPASQRLAEAERLTQQAQSELTALIHHLRPVALEGKGLVRALRELAVDWQRQTGIQTRCELPAELALPLPKEQALFRVAQEALSNIARHSQARTVYIHLTHEKDSVRLAILDDGAGFDPAALHADGFGLHSMHERVEELGGRLEVTSHPDQGTRLVVTMPV